MAISVRCNVCRHVFRVPAAMLGRSVQCPDCQGTFEAIAEDEEELLAEQAARPANQRGRLQEVEDEDEQEVEDEEGDESRRRRSRPPRYATARMIVRGPAIALMVVSVLSLFFSVYSSMVVINQGAPQAGMQPPVFPPGLPGQLPPNKQPLDPAAQKAAEVGAVVGFYSVPVVFMIWSLVVLGGAIQMLRLRTYVFAIAASVVALMPCHFCCFLSLPFGIWALVALNNPVVKDAFE